MSTAHAAVVKKAPVKYTRDTTGIPMYLLQYYTLCETDPNQNKKKS